MVQMSGVVADLVDIGGDPLGKAKVLLQIDRQIRRGSLTDFREGLGILLTVDSDPDHARTPLPQRFGLCRRGLDVLSLGRGHALHRDGVARANGDVANGDGASWIALNSS